MFGLRERTHRQDENIAGQLSPGRDSVPKADKSFFLNKHRPRGHRARNCPDRTQCGNFLRMTNSILVLSRATFFCNDQAGGRSDRLFGQAATTWWFSSLLALLLEKENVRNYNHLLVGWYVWPIRTNKTGGRPDNKKKNKRARNFKLATFSECLQERRPTTPFNSAASFSEERSLQSFTGRSTSETKQRVINYSFSHRGVAKSSNFFFPWERKWMLARSVTYIIKKNFIRERIRLQRECTGLGCLSKNRSKNSYEFLRTRN